MGLPRYPLHLSNVPCPLPRQIEWVHMSMSSPSTRPSPKFRRVGICIITFEACSDFTRVTARWIAQPPKAAFVTRLRPRQLPSEAARQLPDLSTTIWVDPSSTGETRHRGALNSTSYPERWKRIVYIPLGRSCPIRSGSVRTEPVVWGSTRTPANHKIFLRRTVCVFIARGYDCCKVIWVNSCIQPIPQQALIIIMRRVCSGTRSAHIPVRIGSILA